MLLSLAPMEGITGYAFRRVHAEVFSALDRYYTPFISPLPKVGTPFSKRNSRELDPANNQGLNVVPQLLTNDADRFIWAAGLLADVCERSPLPVSVKTRVGIANDDEYDELLALFCRCGIAELIVHPRVQKDFYDGAPRQELYGKTLERAPFPIAYNGDIFTLDDFNTLVAAYPQTRHVMIGRGIVTNPALARMIRGGAGLAREELERFHNELYQAYTDDMGGNAVFRMKEWWSYAERSFADPSSVHRIMRKTRRANEYEAAARKIFSTEKLADSPRFT